jgi:hypothetical protein
LTESDTSYFRRRAQEERAAAEKAASDEARHAHLEIAERYDELAQSIEDQEPGLTFKVVN